MAKFYEQAVSHANFTSLDRLAASYSPDTQKVAKEHAILEVERIGRDQLIEVAGEMVGQAIDQAELNWALSKFRGLIRSLAVKAAKMVANNAIGWLYR